MPVSFSCPKCGQRLALTASKPGEWIDCPNCEAAIRVPGASATNPAPAAPDRTAPSPAAATPSSKWPDPRVLFGAIAAAVLLAVVIAFAVRKPDPPQQARPNDPAPATTDPNPPVHQKNPIGKVEPAQPKAEPPLATGSPPRPDPGATEPPALDQFGNPIGQTQGLARQDEFKGQRLLFWSGDPRDDKLWFSPANPLWKALGEKGFVVRREFGAFETDWLNDADQVWVLSSCSGVKLDPAGQNAIQAFAKDGKGLYLLADNDPCTGDAQELATRLFNVRVSGNYPGEKIAYLKNRQLSEGDIRKYGGDYAVPDHFLLTGVNFVYEGNTISSVGKSDELDVALSASDGKPVVVVSKRADRRVVIDCGFTRYYHSPDAKQSLIEKTAGTPRLAQNIAAYLAGKGTPKKP